MKPREEMTAIEFYEAKVRSALNPRGSQRPENRKPTKKGNMHYKNGREAKNGDKVIWFTSYGPPVSGILYDATAGNDYCNGKIAVTAPNDPMPNLKECLHADDVRAAQDFPDTSKAQ